MDRSVIAISGRLNIAADLECKWLSGSPIMRMGILVVLFIAGVVLAGLDLLAPFPLWVEPRPSPSVLGLHTIVGLSFFCGGLAASFRRSRNSIDLLMMALGLAWFSSDVLRVDSSVGLTAGWFSYGLYIAVLEHLFVVSLGGLTVSALDRVLVRVVYGWWVASGILNHVFWDGPRCCFFGERAANFFVLDRSHVLDDLAGRVDGVLGLVIAGGVVAVVTRRWMRSTVVGRRMLAPFVVAGVPIAAVVLALETEQVVEPWSTNVWSSTGQWVFVVLPVSIFFGLLRARLDHAVVSTLMMELAALTAPVSPIRLRRALANVLRDPSFTLVYWVPDRRAFVDANGELAELPSCNSGRAVHPIEREGQIFAALIYDSILRDDSRLIHAVAVSVRYVIENEYLRTESRARVEKIRALSLRLVESVDAERRNIERNLHDGAQQHLAALAIVLAESRTQAAGAPGLSESLAKAAVLADRAQGDLRDLGRGLHPTILTDAGLGPALESLVEHSVIRASLTGMLPVRLPAVVEATAYFVAAEALTNATKHSQASAVTVTVAHRGGRLFLEIIDNGIGGADLRRGTGLRGLTDRIAAIDGKFDLCSPSGNGTRLTAEIPCE